MEAFSQLYSMFEAHVGDKVIDDNDSVDGEEMDENDDELIKDIRSFVLGIKRHFAGIRDDVPVHRETIDIVIEYGKDGFDILKTLGLVADWTDDKLEETLQRYFGETPNGNVWHVIFEEMWEGWIKP